MLTIGIFLFITLVEFVLIYLKWNELQDAHVIGKMASHIIGVNDKYDSIIDKIVIFFSKIKFLLWIFVPIILLANLFVAWVLSVTYSIISLFF